MEREKSAPAAGNRPVSAWRRDRTESYKPSPESEEEYRQWQERMRLTRAREKGGTFQQNRLLSESSQVKFASTLLKALGNVPKSGMLFVGNLLSAIRDPRGTLEGIGKIIAGYACQIAGEESEYRAYSDKVTKYLFERYGSIDKFIETFETDPVGVAGDISTIFTLGGIAVWVPAKVGMATARMLPAGSRAAQATAAAAGTAEKVAGSAFKVGSAADPLYLPGKVVGAAVQTLPAQGRISSLYERTHTKLQSNGI